MGGAVSGALLGGVIDIYGRNVGAAIARAGGAAGRFMDKYGDLFKRSANKELTHQILLETDPEYKQEFLRLQGTEQ
jgi:hypothetical protein